jgi:hypothetical protein
MKLRKQIVLATGLMLLLAACVLAASGAGGQPPDKGHGVSPRVEIENNTVVFLGYDEGTTWNITVNKSGDVFQNPDDPQIGSEWLDDTVNPYEGTMVFTKGPRFSIAFVPAISSNPNPQIQIPAFDNYRVDVYAGGVLVEDNAQLIVLESTEG